MTIGRRQFIQSSLAGIGTTLLGCGSEQTTRDASHFEPGQRVRLGKTGLKVSRVGLGTGMKGGNRQSNQTRLGEEKFHALLRGCYDRGVTLFDCADLYGTHSYILPALKGIPREKYALVSKIWFPSGGLPEPERPDADVVVERFLKELGTDYIDIIQIHCMTQPDWTGKMEKQMNLMDGLKKKGLLLAHGVSCHSLAALDAAAEHPWVDCIHTRINPYGVAMDDTPAKVVPVLQKAHANGKGIIGMKIIGEGKFRASDEQRNSSIDFVMNLGCVDTVIIGFENLDEVDDFSTRLRNTPKRLLPLQPSATVAVTPSDLDLRLA